MAGLHKRSGLLIGAGSLGSAIAVELVKAGIGHLTVVDHDIYDVNNSVRHVLPLLYAGANKAEALVDHCRRINVFTEVVACTKSVGGSMLPRKLRALVATTDFTIDATGSGEITRLLSRTGQELSRPVLVADLTPSAYGGEVVVGRPGGACAYCFQLEQEADRLPTPPSGPSSGVTPIGCAQPTFFGAGFECSELAAVAARMAVAECGEAGYPTLGYDWAVVSFRSTEHWQSGLLDRSAECPYHS
ncbi:MAG: ThiF family adenylyltransferase [Candidatus Dormibacteraeota bacterium]|nr:ThiF family adenylyltransferase [Candidatus Dormibacteraeota bacterium]